MCMLKKTLLLYCPWSFLLNLKEKIELSKIVVFQYFTVKDAPQSDRILIIEKVSEAQKTKCSEIKKKFDIYGGSIEDFRFICSKHYKKNNFFYLYRNK